MRGRPKVNETLVWGAISWGMGVCGSGPTTIGDETAFIGEPAFDNESSIGGGSAAIDDETPIGGGSAAIGIEFSIDGE